GRLLAEFLRRELAAVGEASVLDDAGEHWLPAPIVARLAQYDWPGNVRQLANLVRHLVIANRGVPPAVHFQALDELALPGAAPAPPPSPPNSPSLSGSTPPPARRPSDITDEELAVALRTHRFSPERAAAALGIPRASIYRLMERSTRVRKASS